jgi:hypothetical protein
LIGLSTSGNSDNLVKAFIKAKEMGVTTVGLAGMDGGEMSKIGLDHCLVVETDSIHRVQECHVIIYHILWDLVHTLLADNRGSLAVWDESLNDKRKEGNMKYVDEFRDPEKARFLLEKSASSCPKSNRSVPVPIRFTSWKSVAATRTRSSDTASRPCCRKDRIDPRPGCPVCVLPMGRVDDCVAWPTCRA